MKTTNLKKTYRDLQGDPAFKDSGSRFVPGDGPLDAKVMFIGEAPGANEDRMGRPFVGASGRLLDDLLATINLKREKVFVTNVVKYRPPGNRDPLPHEVTASLPCLRDEVKAVRPIVVGLLGKYATQVCFPEASITAEHGKAKYRAGRWWIPLYHPAVALYNGAMRPILVEDFQALGRLLDV